MLWSENVIWMTWIFLNLLRFILWPILMNKIKEYCLSWLCSMLTWKAHILYCCWTECSRNVTSSWLIVLFRSPITLKIFYLFFPSIAERIVLESPSIIVDLSISSSSISADFVCFDCVLLDCMWLDAYAFRVGKLTPLSLYVPCYDVCFICF